MEAAFVSEFAGKAPKIAVAVFNLKLPQPPRLGDGFHHHFDTLGAVVVAQYGQIGRAQSDVDGVWQRFVLFGAISQMVRFFWCVGNEFVVWQGRIAIQIERVGAEAIHLFRQVRAQPRDDVVCEMVALLR